MPRCVLPYVLAREGIRQGDLAYLHTWPTDHVGTLAWWLDRLMLLELVPHYGGRNLLFSRRVEEVGSGRWDIYRYPPPPTDDSWRGEYGVSEIKYRETLDRAVQGMIQLMGVRYGWRRIACMFPYYIPVLRRVLRRPTLDLSKGGPWVCSTGVSQAWREDAGVDPRPDLADRVTTPRDLIDPRSIFKYQFTIA